MDKLKLLLENLPLRCKYYQGDEEPCLRVEEKYMSEGHLTCNCDGDISQCDLEEEK